MATEAILADVGMLYKRLLNHRPIIQNEVNYFVREFETKREDSDLKTLQQSMSKSDEMNTVFLNEIACSGPLFKKIKEKAYAIRDACETILHGEELDLGVSPDEQALLDQQVEEYRLDLKKKEQEIVLINEQEIKRVKEEIQVLRESRVKLRSHISSTTTNYPLPADMQTPECSEKEGQVGGELSHPQEQVGGELSHPQEQVGGELSHPQEQVGGEEGKSQVEECKSLKEGSSIETETEAQSS